MRKVSLHCNRSVLKSNFVTHSYFVIKTKIALQRFFYRLEISTYSLVVSPV